MGSEMCIRDRKKQYEVVALLGEKIEKCHEADQHGNLSEESDPHTGLCCLERKGDIGQETKQCQNRQYGEGTFQTVNAPLKGLGIRVSSPVFKIGLNHALYYRLSISEHRKRGKRYFLPSFTPVQKAGLVFDDITSHP